MRKIIGKDRFDIVPIVPGGCMCPKIVQIRDVDITPEPVVLKYNCRDIKTQFKMGDDMPVTFRMCECPVGFPCQNLPRTYLPSHLFLEADLEKECWAENAQGLYFEA